MKQKNIVEYTNISPICIFTYNRISVLQQTISYLEKNFLHEKSDIYVYSDAPKTNDDLKKVNIVREYLEEKKMNNRFRTFTVIKRDSNYGLAKNIIEGVTDIIEKYGKVIVLEDDLLTSKNFLCYMNQVLDFYQNNQKIFAISGYTGDLKSLKHLEDNVYLSYRPSSWGWATWKDRWNSIDWDVADFDEFMKDRKAKKKFNRGGIDMTRMLKHCMEGKNNSWAIRWSYAMSKQDKYCIYPTISKIQNIGFGDDATNCKGIDIYETSLDKSNNCEFNFTNNIKINDQVIKEFAYTFSYTNKIIKRVQKYMRFIK